MTRPALRVVAVALPVVAFLAGCHPSPGAPATPAADPRPAYVSATPGLGRDVVFDVGSTPAGPRLFRDQRVHGGPTTDYAVYLRELETAPLDPDYTTLWPAGSFAGVDVVRDDGRVAGFDVHLGEAAPTTLTPARAGLALQQVVLTLGAVTPVPVRFLLGDRPTEQVLGVATPGPVAPDPALVSPVTIDHPEQGVEVAGSFEADGDTSGGPVTWALTLDGRTVRSGTAGLESGGRWRARVDGLAALDAGGYLLSVSVTVGDLRYVDTRDVTVE